MVRIRADSLMLTVILFVLTRTMIASESIVVFGTGLNDDGEALPADAADPHFTVLETGNPAVVISDSSPYIENNSDSRWIWEYADGLPIDVTRTFRTTFDLTGLDPITASIEGMWGVDNTGIDVELNGVSTGISLPGLPLENFTLLHPFSIRDGFQPGINTLDFIVEDVGVVAAFRASLSGTADLANLVGDFNDDDILDALDINLLTTAVRELSQDMMFDLSENGIVDVSDRNVWVEVISKSFFGDANLDGEFNSTDLIVMFLAGEFSDGIEDNSGWEEGDFGGDGDFDTDDLVLAFQTGSYEKGQRAAVVPEPSTVMLALIVMFSLLRSRTRNLAVVSNICELAGER